MKTIKQKALVGINVLALAGLVGFSGYEYKELKDTRSILTETQHDLRKQVKETKTLQEHYMKLEDERDALSEDLQTKMKELDEKGKSLEESSKTVESQKQEIEQLKKNLASRRAEQERKKQEQAQAQQSTPAPTPVSAPAKAEPKQESSGKTMTFRATAYSSQEPLEMGGGTTTASGTKVQQGRTIAVDPSVIPLGSKVRITCPDYPSVNGVYTAEDTGGAIKGNIIDIYIHDLGEVYNFGRRTIQVEII